MHSHQIIETILVLKSLDKLVAIKLYLNFFRIDSKYCKEYDWELGIFVAISKYKVYYILS